jgi:replicative DNA helicase
MSSIAIELADHLVGNLYYSLDRVPLLAGQLLPETMRYVASPEAAMVYSEMCRLMGDPESVLSAGTLDAGLRAQNFDMAWLTQLQARLDMESLPTLTNYASEIENAAQLRMIAQYCNEANQATGDENARAEIVAADLMGKLSTASERTADTMHSSEELVEGLRGKIDRIRSGERVLGASTGLQCLDRVFRLGDGKLITLGARPSQGKTSTARWIFYKRAQQIALSGEDGQVVFFSSDDTAEAVTLGLACSIASLDSNDVELDQNMGHDDWQRLDDALAEIESLPIVIDEMNNPSVEAMYYRCAMLNAQKRVRLAGQDYMGLIRVDNAKSERQEAERSANGVKGIGRTLGFPWLNISQLRKSVEDRADKWPTDADLMYSGTAESDVVMLAMCPEYYVSKGSSMEGEDGSPIDIMCDEQDRKNVMLINVAKNKGGRTGRVRMGFNRVYGRPYDIDRTDLNAYDSYTDHRNPVQPQNQ